MADKSVHSAECGFVDDVSPGKVSDFTSTDCSGSDKLYLFSMYLLILLLKL